MLPAKVAGGEEIPDLLNWIEEADTKMLVHVELAVHVKQCKRVVRVSNNSAVLPLGHTPYFQSLRVKEIWQQYGIGEMPYCW